MTPDIRIAGPEALPGFMALVDEAAQWLWARGIHQWTPGGIHKRRAELLGKLESGWLVTAVSPDVAEPAMVAGCLLTRTQPPQWQGRERTAAYLELLAVARAFAGRGLPRFIIAACADLARRERLDALRLDCWAGNETLKALYRGLGFRAVAELTHQGHRIRLFEKELASDAQA